jgi:hypothetical protein
MPSPIECDIISVDGEKLLSVRLSTVPQRGDELDLDLGRKQTGGGTYRIVDVRYHLYPRTLAGMRWAFRTDDLVGISIFVEPTR